MRQDQMQDVPGYCHHMTYPLVVCAECLKEKAEERREDELRQTLIDLTLAFNRMATAVEQLEMTVRAK